MARYRGPKNRIARREGIDLGLKTPGSAAHANLMKRLKITPGMHGQKRKRKPSDYGIQLREKQKVKRLYGLLEKQFKNYFAKASSHTQNTGEVLLSLLERRLDNVIYRLNLAPTRTSARQFVTHGHVLVDNKKELYAFSRNYKDEKIIVVINNNNKTQYAKIKIPANTKWIDLLNVNAEYRGNKSKQNIGIPAKWGVILKRN